MNFKTPITSLLTLIASLSTLACAQELPGHVESLQGEFQLKNTDGELIDVPTGPMTMSVESKGFFFDSKVTIKVGSQEVKFKVPKTAFTSDKSLEVDADTISQPVSLNVNVHTDFLGSSTRNDSEYCTYSGFCGKYECTTSYYSRKGSSTSDCGYRYGFHYNCSGSREVEMRTDSYNDTYTARFSKDKKDVGVYTSQPVYHSSSYKTRNLSTCR